MKTIELKIDRQEVLRYLGYRGQEIDHNMTEMIDECRKEVQNVILPRAVYEYKKISSTDKGIEIDGTNLILSGKDIAEHLKNSKECLLMAVTLGNDIEKRTRLYEKVNLTKALIIDACATTAVEEVCDIIEEKVRKEAESMGMNITFRYSPGYGDLPLDIQNNFLRVLDAQKKIGLTVSENNLLFPRKSVTAIIGIVSADIKINKKSCENCRNYNNCTFRREGENCGA
ncbi:vitamin B12 dependent-methionine synthase activation domain-containing protein [uncultured Clostridium sp.]|uniref:vitamin B12 dependent-methionine synthase activation domain-containing protein n=1 Tax=uncultured Clostridium sp. TaxID=59620 RepID=UPI0025F764A0|nr:vitamin B12 dependent-methionine synthase activation domain-containing protein [uncultured Clostridium sp.]